jgi:acyl dehydratase
MTTENLTEAQQLETLKGHRLGPYTSFNPVSATQIWQWCSAMGDNNPSYLPGEGQIAPPAMMQMWTMRDIHDRYAPGSTDAPPYQVFADMQAMGYPANVAVSYDIQFHRYLKVGERARHYTTVVNISDRKSTALGVGFFVTERVEYLTQDASLFAEALITYFQYQPAPDKVGARHADKQDAVGGADDSKHLSSHSENWQPDFRNIDTSTIVVGDRLPELAIEITHKLIVGGAIATQDFIPVHHNLPAAQAAAMPDIFMNILTTSGLLARYLSDWAGAGSRLKQLKFNLMAPNLPGDIMVMEGEVVELTQSSSEALVTVSFGGRNRLGYHTRGSAVLALPNTSTAR